MGTFHIHYFAVKFIFDINDQVGASSLKHPALGRPLSGGGGCYIIVGELSGCQILFPLVDKQVVPEGPAENSPLGFG